MGPTLSEALVRQALMPLPVGAHAWDTPRPIPRPTLQNRARRFTTLRAWAAQHRLLPLLQPSGEAAYVTRVLGESARWPASKFSDRDSGGLEGLVLVVDHGHPGAMQALQEVQAACPKLFADGTVIGVERLPASDSGVLERYRRAARVPVLSVDMRQPEDRVLLGMALVATRVVNGVLRGPVQPAA